MDLDADAEIQQKDKVKAVILAALTDPLLLETATPEASDSVGMKYYMYIDIGWNYTRTSSRVRACALLLHD